MKEKFNRARLVFWAVMLGAMFALWTGAVVFGFIGNTDFIGHVSMFALVLTAGAAVEASLPSVGQGKEE